MKRHMLATLALVGGLGLSAPLHSSPVPQLPVLMQSTGTTTSTLPRLDISTMKLWDWNQPWAASQWANPNSTIPWRFDRIAAQSDGRVLFLLDSIGAPQLQAVNGTPAQTSGLWEVDVTLPQLREGLVVAPLWLYNSTTRDEIDFEFAGLKGLDVTMHCYPGGVHKKVTTRLFPWQNLSGRRFRLGIRLNTTTGRAEMIVNGTTMRVFDRATTGFFISSGLKPFIEMWAADPSKTDLVNWVGTWRPLASGQRLTMAINGYRYSR